LRKNSIAFSKKIQQFFNGAICFFKQALFSARFWRILKVKFSEINVVCENKKQA